MHQTHFKIRSTQVDTFGHLNNAAYLEIYEWARWEWAEESQMGLLEWVERGVGPAIVHIDISFERELRMHDDIRVRTRIDAIEGLRCVVYQEMVKSDGQVASKMRLTFVMFDLKKRRAIPLPDGFIQAFQAQPGI